MWGEKKNSEKNWDYSKRVTVVQKVDMEEYNWIWMGSGGGPERLRGGVKDSGRLKKKRFLCKRGLQDSANPVGPSKYATSAAPTALGRVAVVVVTVAAVAFGVAF